MLTTNRTLRGVVVLQDGVALNGRRPRDHAEHRLGELREPQCLYIVASPLLGYGLGRRAQTLPIDSAVLLVEYDSERAALHGSDADEMPHHPRIVWTTSTRAARIAGERLVSACAIRRARLIIASRMDSPARNAYDRLHQQVVADIAAFWRNRGVQVRLGRRWIANVLRNSILRAEGAHAGLSFSRVVVVVGAGPSLNRHAQWLANLIRNRPPCARVIQIVALDTALPALAAHGIQPDAIWTMDGQLANARDFAPWHWSSTTLFGDLSVHHSIARRFAPEQRCLFFSLFSALKIFDDLSLRNLVAGFPIVPARGSVAPSALHVMATDAFGFGAPNDLITVGIDFVYTPPASHATYSTPDRIVRRTASRTLYRDGWDPLLNRPLEASWVDGALSWHDRLLDDHAAQMHHTVATVKETTVHRLGNSPSTTFGALAINEREAYKLVLSGQGPAPRRTDRTVPNPQSDERLAAMHALYARLLAQEQRLGSSGAVHFDVGLDFVLFDMPQWPRMMLRPEWFALHKESVLRSVRDYRRRVARLLAIVDSRLG